MYTIDQIQILKLFLIIESFREIKNKQKIITKIIILKLNKI